MTINITENYFFRSGERIWGQQIQKIITLQILEHFCLNFTGSSLWGSFTFEHGFIWNASLVSELEALEVFPLKSLKKLIFYKKIKNVSFLKIQSVEFHLKKKIFLG